MNVDTQVSNKNIEQKFLQSFEWEQFQQLLGNETFRIKENLFIVQKLPLVGKYAYSPRGPIFEKEYIPTLLVEIKRKGFGWIRIEPEDENTRRLFEKTLPKNIKMYAASKNVQPKEILVMNISKTEEMLLSEMKSKTRYNIRLAQKKGVQIIVSNEKKYQDRFIELVYITAKRAGIRPHTKEHYRKIFNVFGDSAMLYNAFYEGKIIASHMMIFLNGGAIYLHGGSGNEYRNVMAPFLLQWKAMQDAKERGCLWYDFGGVSTEFSKKEVQESKIKNPQNLNDWSGITLFKQGFCCKTESIQFPGTYDIVLSPWKYRVYRIINKLRKLV
ncbi:MAG: peptidoglycan bridge formation glycyltransferase FemA/FemB family protein [Candidatus Moraniibacteriota bacterium]|nr:MAG: peptidoglycan bridge formation glycyltransferase FemA/FemB family protein [Candidatus Moranbacteria bacterium]